MLGKIGNLNKTNNSQNIGFQGKIPADLMEKVITVAKSNPGELISNSAKDMLMITPRGKQFEITLMNTGRTGTTIPEKFTALIKPCFFSKNYKISDKGTQVDFYEHKDNGGLPDLLIDAKTTTAKVVRALKLLILGVEGK